jgi:hypothetical protein
MKVDTYIASRAHICSVLSDSNSVRAVRHVGDEGLLGWGLQGWGLLDIHPGIELVTSAVWMDIL